MPGTVRATDLARSLTCQNPRCQCHRLRVVHCPAHADDHPSLSVTERDGRLLVHCHAGCPQEAVVEALRERGLWRWMGSVRRTRYEVRDPAGQLVAVHVRTDGPGGKRLWWERPDGRPGLACPVEELPLYGIHGVGPAARVVLVEGEKARDALSSRCPIPVVATVTGASCTPSPEALQPLAGRTVYLWPDADRPGVEHMRRIGLRLFRLDPSTNLFWIVWRDAPPGGDAADYQGDVGKLLRSARPWRPREAAQLVAESILLDALDRVRSARNAAQVTLAVRRAYETYMRQVASHAGTRNGPSGADATAQRQHVGGILPPVRRSARVPSAAR